MKGNQKRKRGFFLLAQTFLSKRKLYQRNKSFLGKKKKCEDKR
jgi:hypothetical protein